MAANKELQISLFGEMRLIGEFPATLHTDIRTIVEMIRRGRAYDRHKMGPERITQVKNLFEASPYRSIEAFSQQMTEWKAQRNLNFNANSYYDAERVENYHSHNAQCQKNISTTCALAMQCSHPYPLLLDLGCGSGLSSLAFIPSPSSSTNPQSTPPTASSTLESCNSNCLIIGIDSSQAMLEKNDIHVDRVLADLSYPLPFRHSVHFDGLFSIGVLHYLFYQDENKPNKLDTFFYELLVRISPIHAPISKGAALNNASKVHNPVVIQFFPNNDQKEVCVSTAWKDNIINAFNKAQEKMNQNKFILEFFIDTPHHTKALRFFVTIRPARGLDTIIPGAAGDGEAEEDLGKIQEPTERSEGESEEKERGKESFCMMYKDYQASCLLCAGEELCSKKHPHVSYVRGQHVQYFWSQLRTRRRQEESNQELFLQYPSLDACKERADEIIKFLHNPNSKFH